MKDCGSRNTRTYMNIDAYSHKRRHRSVATCGKDKTCKLPKASLHDMSISVTEAVSSST